MRGGATPSQSVRDEVAELLGVSPDTIDPAQDLIASGLDSIRMMSLSGRWRKRGIDVDFATLAADPTVAAWSDLVAAHAPGADALDAAPDGGASSADHGGPAAPFPLAPLQHAYWVGRNDQQQLGGVAAHLYVEFDGTGVDPGRLAAAAAELAVRHPMLRVEIMSDGTQRIGDRELPVKISDLRELDAEAVERQLLATREAKSHQLLDGEVLELSLSLLPGGRTRLHVDLDMQAGDAVSYRRFMSDLAVLYAGGTPPQLDYTYREYRAAMSRLEAARSAQDQPWWSERIPSLPGPPSLPLVPTSEQSDPRRSVRRWHWFDAAAREALFAAARSHGVTPAMAFAASYAGTLARWSTSRRFLLNLPMFGREPFHPQVDMLVGDFTSSLMLDVDLTQADSPLSRAVAVQQALHSSARHLGYSGLSVLRDLSRHRGVQTLAPFVFTSGLGLGDLFGGEVTEIFGAPVWTISQGPQVLLDAQVTPLGGGLLVNWDVREEAFQPGVVDAMFGHQLDELHRLADPDAWTTPDSPEVPESQRVVRAAVNSTVAGPSGEALHTGFFRQAERQPDAPAVFARSGDLSYRQLRDQALAVAAALRAEGVRAGDTIAVLGPKNAEQVPAVLGILAAGAVYLPIGADQPRERAERLLQTGSVRLALLSGAQQTPSSVPALRLAEVLSGPTSPDESISVASDPEALAYVLFTSGSTGEPKGVELTHDAVMNTVEFLLRHFDIGASDRWLSLATLESDMSVPDIFANLRAGGAIVVVDEDQRRDPDAWASLIHAHRVTALNFMPGWLEMLLAVGDGRLSSLRAVAVGGDWVRPELARRLRLQAPRARFAGLGGATETAVHATIFEVDEAAGLLPNGSSVPYGVPLPNMACRVVSESGSDCPDWVIGELWVTGRGIARGYRGRPDLTGERFVEYPLHGVTRSWYRTGDLARYWPDGTLEFVGRADHRTKISGYRVELGEVEAALGRIPGVHAAVAAVLPAAGGSDGLAALVRVDDDSGLTAGRIRDALIDLVPAHMIPRWISPVDRIPFTDGGKIDRAAVACRLDQEFGQLGGATGSVTGPRSTLERALCHIVAGVLGRDGDAMDVHDDFFSLGGDSVLATKAVAEIRVWLDSPRTMVSDMFAARTVAALAEVLIGRESDTGRMESVAEAYLEVAAMSEADVMVALDAGSANE
ncbi:MULTISPECIES: non-ribosomal peptide synthetase [Mycobacteriaceae]|uniref:Phenyloxazoline synthase MbtB n=3 Tax=Mycobacteriaceae TaxID=1762 RepID=F5YZ37_MYCSD|nr:MULTISPECIES: non-ribosomal peptide synthetase [Mycobacteriaceae]AEF35529.1 phenyloxazoline synthase MbtB [Mycolicibacter sinensis]BBX11281.1 phenyloxazoline synthase MbtB [Mycobacterium novum]